MALAVSSYQRLRAHGDDGGLLNLSWTIDERDLLSVDLTAVLAQELSDELRSDLPYVHSYFVDDPYGEAQLKASVAAHFGLDDGPWGVTCGAGVNSVLQALAMLAAGARAYVVGDVYPDLPHWVGRLGGSLVSGTGQGGAAHERAVRETSAVLVLTERPSLTDDDELTPDGLRQLCDACAAEGVVVVVDESNANYYPPRFSAAGLVAHTRNLVVVRGLSKAYWLGGLRFGYCLTSAPVTERVRSVVAPLLASSLSIRLARAVLDLGDLTARLRDRITEARYETAAVLAAAEITTMRPASRFLPFLVCDDESTPAALERRGVLTKRHLSFSAGRLEPATLTRLSVPLAPDRMQRLRECLGVGASPAADLPGPG